jgi:SAM-dependent methyltransferase
MVQFSYFDGKREVIRNFGGEELERQLDEVLALPFSEAHIRSTSGDTHVRITRRGRVLVSQGKVSGRPAEPALSHDHIKRQPLPADVPDAFLQTIGVMNSDGRVRASMWRKFRQINQFLRLVELTLMRSHGTPERVHIVDCGCGSAYLTFAAYHYLNHTLAVPTQVTGIDVNSDLIDRCRRLGHSLEWSGLEFRTSAIADFSSRVPPDMVLSLHACDTATDEAIAQGILWESNVILSAPCCQHELHRQLHATLFRPVLRHGILRERLADLLTDTVRALVLRIMGYRTGVIEFVSPDYTSKNLMIRAEKGLQPGDEAFVQEYRNLKAYWAISPVIEDLVGDPFRQWVTP